MHHVWVGKRWCHISYNNTCLFASVNALFNQDAQKIEIAKMMQHSSVVVKRPYKKRTPKELWRKK